MLRNQSIIEKVKEVRGKRKPRKKKRMKNDKHLFKEEEMKVEEQ